MPKEEDGNLNNIAYDEYIIELYENYLLKCKEIYKRDALVSSKHLLYWIIRKMRKEGVGENDLIDYIKDCSNEFSDEKDVEQISRIEDNINKINKIGKA